MDLLGLREAPVSSAFLLRNLPSLLFNFRFFTIARSYSPVYYCEKDLGGVLRTRDHINECYHPCKIWFPPKICGPSSHFLLTVVSNEHRTMTKTHYLSFVTYHQNYSYNKWDVTCYDNNQVSRKCVNTELNFFCLIIFFARIYVQFSAQQTAY